MRRLRIALYAITAILVATAGTVSYSRPLYLGLPVTRKDWLALHFFDGRVRLFWIQSFVDPIRVHHEAPMRRGDSPRFDERRSLRKSGRARTSVLPRRRPLPALVVSHDLENAPLCFETAERPCMPGTRWYAEILIGSRRHVPSFALKWDWPVRPSVSSAPSVQTRFVRLPTWLIAGVFTVLSVGAVARGPVRERRRRRRNECVGCGYSLRALPGPRCPECGTPLPGPP